MPIVVLMSHTEVQLHTLIGSFAVVVMDLLMCRKP